ncbi:hypothetical protein J1N35_042497 [Gossypium stocksii]|uniref:Uncharacterized protein n=1 Tax=Gossypium stocksii TaxID=47602 RepID=A0A9D3ZEI2_9ROSI|nr:hypothetical protein J1N35_042497 [Gossypium stocksii]
MPSRAQVLAGSPRNPQTVSFLELLDLPYVLDNASDSRSCFIALKRSRVFYFPLSFDALSLYTVLGGF